MRVAGVAGPALTDVVAGRVGAERVLPAGSRYAAFVHVHAPRRRVGRVVCPPLLAHAEGLRLVRAAEGVRAAAHPLARLCAGEGERDRSKRCLRVQKLI